MKRGRFHIDFETRSRTQIRLGADVYSQCRTTAPLMLAYYSPDHMLGVAVNDFMSDARYRAAIYPVRDERDFKSYRPECPPLIRAALGRGDTFVAHNARFEQAVWYHICHLLWGWDMPVRWSCTAARARYWGLRASLDGAASDLEVVHQKNKDGDQFIKLFCKPREYQGRQALGVVKTLWMDPVSDTPEQLRLTGKLKEIAVPSAEYAKGIEYCRGDVLAEKDIDDLLPDLPEFEQSVWELDFKLNTRGMPIDLTSVARAQQFSSRFTEIAFKRFDEITGLRPTQRQKVLDYIEQREDVETLGDLKSKTLKRIVLADLPEDMRDVISIRLQTSQASIKKLDTMIHATDADGFARGMFLYGGAHTMRWSSKRLQFQNFKRGNAKVQNIMFEFLELDCWLRGMGDNGGPPLDELPSQPPWIEEAGLRFVQPLGALAQSMRGFVAAPRGRKLVVGDYAQIEARVLAWLARCMWLLEAFGQKDDVYVRFAGTHMYNRAYDDYFVLVDGKRKVRTELARERQVAKSAVLGCGFGLGSRKFVEYCDNSDLIITQEESDRTIKAYRDAHPEIADYNSGLWKRVEKAAIAAVTNEGYTVELANTGVSFHVHRLDAERYWLVCTLPSGRHIAYYRPKVRLGTKWGRVAEILSFRTEWNGKSYREDTYGGKLVENLVQGTARDICAQGALNVEAAGYPVIGLVHDEIISLPDADFGSHEAFCKEMCTLPAWVTDCPVEAEGGTMLRYGK